MQVPFFKPEIGDEEVDEVIDSLRNGWLTSGPKVFAFEKSFAEFLGGDVEAVAVNSATAGLHLALEAIGVGIGDEVIVPDFTFTATAEVVRYLGADPVFVDVDPATLNMTPAGAEAAMSARTKAIMPVHFAGLPCEMAGFVDLARSRGVKIVEDSAHAFPARSNGTLIGRHGCDATVFSFYANKTMTTGEGGMLVTPDKQLAKRARSMRLHGFDRDAIARFTKGDWRYDVIAPGFKYNMTDLAASLGIHQLRRADSFRERRAAVAALYREGLRDLPVVLQDDAPAGSMHSWHLFVVRLLPECRIGRDQLFDEMSARGIRCSVHYTPLHKFTYWKQHYGLSADQFPVSEAAGQTIISLPLFVSMSREQVDYVVKQLRELIAPQ